MKRLAGSVVALLCLFAAVTVDVKAQSLDPENTIYLDVRYGRVVIKLRPDIAPGHVERIKKLTRQKFYDGIVFHRVIDGFMAQTGDPTGTGTGSSKLKDLRAEFSLAPFTRGVVGMARSQSRNSANSQFFIMFGDGHSLNGKYTVWGEVVKGMKFVDKLQRGEPPIQPDKIIKMRVAADVK